MEKQDKLIYSDPFIFKLKKEVYLSLTSEIINDSDFFINAKKIKNELVNSQDNSGTCRKYKSEFESYSKILSEDINYNDPEAVISLLHLLDNYNLFFKELGASLKFNPLSKKNFAVQLQHRILDLLNTYLQLIKPKAAYLAYDLIFSNSQLKVEGSDVSFTSQKLYNYFTADSVGENFRKNNFVVYLVTISAGIDDEVKSLSAKGETLDAFLLNGIGAAAAEMTANDLNLFINNKFNKIYKRFSPGYGDWIIEDQEKIFSLLKPDKIGVTLCEGNIMIPEKTTSGIMGY